MITFVLTAALAASPMMLRAMPRVELADRIVRIGDIADLRAMPGARRAALAARIVLRLPDGKRSVALSRAALVSLMRRAMPGMAVTPGGAGSVVFTAPVPDAKAAMPTARPIDPRPAIGKGDALRLVSTIGPVRIERAVTALQDARGKRIFVRDGDGQVFAVRIGDATPAGTIQAGAAR